MYTLMILIVKLLNIPTIMANPRGPMTNLRTATFSGKQSHLPPKSPAPGLPQLYGEYSVGPSTGSSSNPKIRDAYKSHQRTSSESFLIEEQPSWLDDLLNEPETPVRRAGHRRSSSDSVAYLEASNNFSNLNSVAQEDFKFGNLTSATSWGSADFEHFRDFQVASFSPEVNTVERQKNKAWDSSLNSRAYASSLPSGKDKFTLQNPIISYDSQEQDGRLSTSAEKQEPDDGNQHELRGSHEKRDAQNAKASSDSDTKRSKQQYAQRSRVRKLQYIAELERHVQGLQAEGSEVAAEMEFLDQQNLILNMENKALKQRLDSLTQEQLIKYMEQEVLEREIARLRAVVYQLQQSQQPVEQYIEPQKQQSSKHQRRSSRDLDSQFAGLSLRNKDTSTGRGHVNGPLHI